jgi:hypothetical protein
MARPKGSRNKTAETKVEEFNYEDSDSLYQEVMSKGAIAPVFQESTIQAERFESEAVAAPTMTRPAVSPAQGDASTTSTIFLVEGRVRLDQMGADPIVAEQRRIVLANNIDEALAKFSNYFTSMSGSTQRYTIVQAGASEAIQ